MDPTQNDTETHRDTPRDTKIHRNTPNPLTHTPNPHRCSTVPAQANGPALNLGHTHVSLHTTQISYTAPQVPPLHLENLHRRHGAPIRNFHPTYTSHSSCNKRLFCTQHTPPAQHRAPCTQHTPPAQHKAHLHSTPVTPTSPRERRNRKVNQSETKQHQANVKRSKTKQNESTK